ncbi:MAG: CDP-alcohol phosphatidyltransferase family protein [Vicinamibacterales bacterium]
MDRPERPPGGSQGANQTSGPRPYVFRSECRSLLFPLIDRAWCRPLLRCLPGAVPANALTLGALACAAAAAALCLAASAGVAGDGALIGAAVCVWCYHTLDDIDGPQARRTGTGGPAGELLDHGVDAHAIYLTTIGFAAWLGLPGIVVLGLAALGGLTVWAAVWDHRHTGTFYSGRVSEVEGCVALVVLLLAAAWMGQPRLAAPVAPGLPSPRVVLAVVTATGLLAQVAGHWRRVARPRPWTEAAPLLGCLALVALVAVLSGAGLAWSFLAGLVIARASRRLIEARLAGGAYAAWDRVAWVAAGAAAIAPGSWAWLVVAGVAAVEAAAFHAAVVSLGRPPAAAGRRAVSAGLGVPGAPGRAGAGAAAPPGS